MKQLSRLGIQRMIDGVGSAGNGGGSVEFGAGLASMAWVDEKYLSKDFFLRLFGIHGTDDNDDPVDVTPNDMDTTVTDIEAKLGFWSDSFVSAFGRSTGGGGGGGVTLYEPINSINSINANPTSANRTLIWTGTQWTYSSIVTSVSMAVPTGFEVTGSPVSSTGTLALTFASGYSLPLTADVTKGVTAYGWGDHAQAGYALASNVYSKTEADNKFLPLSAGSGKPLTGTLYSQSIYPKNNAQYDLGGSTNYWRYLYVNRIYLASGVYLEYDSTNLGVHLVGAGFYSDSFVSAFGASTGGGGITLNQPLSSINSLNANPSSSGQTLVWNGTSWGYTTLGSGSVGSIVVNGTAYSSVNGVVTLPDYPTKVSDLTNDSGFITNSALADYLPLTGGTLTGSLAVNANLYLRKPITTNATTGIQTSDQRIYAKIGDDTETYGIRFYSRYNPSDSSHTISTYFFDGKGSLIYNTGAAGSQQYQSLTLGATYKRSENYGIAGRLNLYMQQNEGSAVTVRYGSIVTTHLTANRTYTLPNADGTVALESSNVASATKLETARTLWGQSFDGTANVDGKITVSGIGTFAIEQYKGNNKVFSLGSGASNTSEGTEYGILSLYHDGTEYIRLYTHQSVSSWFNGYRLGIGTSNPSYKLHVNGTFGVGGASDMYANVNDIIKVRRTSSGGAFISLYANNQNNNAWRVGSNTAHSFKLIYTTNNFSSDSSYFDVTSSGDVGIGTNSPSYKLDVNGTFGVTSTTTLSSTLTVNAVSVLQTSRPSANSTYNLGHSNYYWNYLYVNRIYLTNSVYLEYNSTNAGVRLVGAGFYSDSFVSAFGASTSSGGITLNQPLASINNLNANPSSSNKTLVWNGSAWTYADLGSGSVSSVVVNGTSYSPVSGVVTLPNYPTTLDNIADGTTRKLANYLPLTGGTLSGALAVTAYLYLRRAITTNATTGIQTSDQRIYAKIGNDTETYGIRFYSQYNPSDSSHTISTYFFDGKGSLTYYRGAVGSQQYQTLTLGASYKRSENYGLAGRITLYMQQNEGSAVTVRYGNIVTTHLTANRTYTLPNADGTVALESSNVASATKLQTARTIWGQSFDGSSDVDGTLSIKTTSTSTHNVINAYAASLNVNALTTILFGKQANNGDSAQLVYQYVGTNSTDNKFYLGFYNNYQLLTITNGGNVGIGTATPAYKLDVSGTFNASGNVSIGGTLGVTGAVTLSSTLGVTGITTISNTLNVDGTTVAQTMRPKTNNTYHLGHSSYYWKYLYIKRIYFTSSVYLEYNSTNAGISIVGAGLYSDSYISAFGASTGGSSLSLNGVLSSINSSSLAAPSATGQTVVWDGSAWQYSTTSNVTLKADKIIANSGLTISSGSLSISAGNISLPGNINAYGNIITNSKIAIGYSSVSSSYQFYCKNNGYISGTLTQGSDIRRKNIVGDVDMLDINNVASAPIFRFTWKDRDDSHIYAGTSAQYWKDKLPETVLSTDEGYLSMDYGVTALIATIITAKKVVDHERRIRDLEEENRKLRKEIDELKAA